MFWNLLRKELREVFTISSLISVVLLSTIYASIGKGIGSIAEEATKKPVVAVVNLDVDEFGRTIETAVKTFADAVYTGSNIEEALERLKKANGSALLIIQRDFSQKLASNQQAKIKVVFLLKGLGIMDTIPSESFSNFLNNLERQIVMTLLIQHGVESPNFVLDPVGREEATMYLGKTLEGLSPSQILSYFSNRWMIVSVVIMMLILMSGGAVISSMGLEKENKTLETLLTMPVPRSYIILAKILAAAISGLVMAAIYMAGFSFYMKSFEISVAASLKMEMNFADYGLVGLSMFSALLCGIGLAMLLGLLSKDFKSAQTMTFPLVALAIFSMMITMFKDVSTMPMPLKTVVYAVPFTHAMTSVRNIFFDNYAPVMYGVLYNFILAGVLLGIIVKIFNSDSLITGMRLFKSKGKQSKLTRF